MKHFKILFFVLMAGLFIAGCSSKKTSTPASYGKPKPSTPATMRPYTIRGKTYYPATVRVGETERGVASWYGPNFHGKKTSNGETYNMYAQTAAHKTYPMNTMVKVTNLNNRKSTIVRINDRGPFVSGRVIDLSKKAASDIGVVASGTAPVKLEVVGFDGRAATPSTPPSKRVYVGGNFMVQVGAFRNRSGAEIYQVEHDGESGYRAEIREFVEGGEPFYRVFLTGFKSEEEARDFARSTHISGAFIVRQ